MTVAVILVVFLLLAAVYAFVQPAGWSGGRFAPLGFMLLLLLVLFITGHLR